MEAIQTAVARSSPRAALARATLQIEAGDEVMVLPTGFTTKVAGIDECGGPVEAAFPPMSVSIRLADDLDVSRGDMLCRPHNAPTSTQDIDANDPVSKADNEIR